MESLNTNKVAWLVTTMGYGDSLMYWENILKQYFKVFPELRIFSSDKKVIKSNDKLPFEYSVDLLKIPLGKGLGGYKKQIILAKPGIIFNLYKYQPDLIVISEFGILSIYAMLFSLFSKTKVLLLVENHPYKGLALGQYSIRRYIRKVICYFSDVILTNNMRSKDYLTNIIGVHEDKIIAEAYLVTIIDQNILQGIKLIKPNKTTFLYVGRMLQSKGLYKLVDAICALTEMERKQVVFWMVGDGDDRATIEQLIDSRGVSESFVFFGNQPYEKLSSFYRNADIFVLPTFRDYRALVGFEAISFKLPLLLSIYDGAISEVLEEGKNGYSFDPYDIEDFSNKIKILINNKEQLQKFSDYSYSLSKEYTLGKAVDNLITASNQALNC